MSIIKEYKAMEVREGAGVIVNRVFSNNEAKAFDPFLMLDYFITDGKDELPGFPWHPHKGIETISYFLKGRGIHEDSLGNKGVISSGELQWMTAGKGIMHQEMLDNKPDGIQGFQFWVNLPQKDKLTNPDYAYIKKGMMKEVRDCNTLVKVIAGQYNEAIGVIDKSNLGITMLHVEIQPEGSFSIKRDEEKQGFIFVFEGSGSLSDASIKKGSAYTLEPGEINITSDSKLSFIYAEGKPLREPIFWSGPIVMNSRQEIIETFRDIENGTFTKK